MKEIRCPRCGNVITVDDADFAALLSQVRTEEFNTELDRRMADFRRVQQAEEGLRAAQARQKAADALRSKDEELRRKEEQINRILTEAANERNIAAEHEKALIDRHKAEKEGLEKEVEWYKNFKAKRNVKLIGEDLEQYCYGLYNQMLLPVMPGATLEKDNDPVRQDGETKGTKGDFIFRDKEDGVEYMV